MLRRVATAGLIGLLLFGAGLTGVFVYQLTRPEPGAVRAARDVLESVSMSHSIGASKVRIDQRAAVLELTLEAADLDDLSRVSPPAGYELTGNAGTLDLAEAKRGGRVGEWSGPDPRERASRCVITLDSLGPVGSTASDSTSGTLALRLAAVCAD